MSQLHMLTAEQLPLEKLSLNIPAHTYCECVLVGQGFSATSIYWESIRLPSSAAVAGHHALTVGLSFPAVTVDHQALMSSLLFPAFVAGCRASLPSPCLSRWLWSSKRDRSLDEEELAGSEGPLGLPFFLPHMSFDLPFVKSDDSLVSTSQTYPCVTIEDKCSFFTGSYGLVLNWEKIVPQNGLLTI